MQLIPYIINRLKEPSTYVGLGTFLAALGLHLSDVQVSAIVTLSLGIGGLLSAFIPERKAS